jgi:hypothetical protein
MCTIADKLAYTRKTNLLKFLKSRYCKEKMTFDLCSVYIISLSGSAARKVPNVVFEIIATTGSKSKLCRELINDYLIR